MEYTVTSFSQSRNGNSAQITVAVGEGANRRSFTRHLHRQSRGLMGLNIDPRAIPLNERRESELAEAKRKLATAEATVKSIEKKLEEVSKAPEGDIIAESMLLAAHVLLEEQLEIAQDDVTAAADMAIDAEEKLSIVRQELPLMMSFDTTN